MTADSILRFEFPILLASGAGQRWTNCSTVVA
jgi:hypothetical protein